MKKEDKADLIERLEQLRDNDCFPSKEDEDNIEHMDIGYDDFKALISEAIVCIKRS